MTLTDFIKKFSHNQKLKWSVVILAIISVLIYKFWHKKTEPNNPKVVEALLVKNDCIREIKKLIGVVQPKYLASIKAKSNGTFFNEVSSGKKVKQGDSIAKIRNKNTELKYTLLQAAEQIAKKQYDRAVKLSERGAASTTIIEDKRKSWIEAQKQLSEAKALSGTIEAPFDGIVGAFKIHDGAEVKEGDVIVSFYDPQSMTVEFNVPLYIAQRVSENNTVLILGKQYALGHMQKMLDTDTHMCPAYVDIKCDECIPGEAINIGLVLAKKELVVVVPHNAIFLKNGKNYVYIIEDNKAVLTEVEIGIQEDQFTEITEGLKAGDLIISKGQNYIYPDMDVKPVEISNKS